MKMIYLDHAATTPIDPLVAEEMAPWTRERFGNPSSLYGIGREARDALDVARERLSDALGCLFGEVTFTSSGTEAANLAVVGAAFENLDSTRRKVLIGAAEHHCVLNTVKVLRKLGFQPELLATDREGKVRTSVALDRIDDGVLLVSVQHANNETGAINDLTEISRRCREQGVLIHADGVQSFCSLDEREAFSPAAIGCDMYTVSSHKIYGPKGVGAMYLRSGVKVSPVIVGGGQERDLRAGTENVAGIVGFGKAAEIASSDLPRLARRREARDAFWQSLDDAGFTYTRTVQKAECLSGHAHLIMGGAKAETMLVRLDRAGVCAGSGSACSGGSLLPSHVLTAGGWGLEEAKSAMRFSFGVSSTVEGAREAAEILVREASAVASAQR